MANGLESSLLSRLKTSLRKQGIARVYKNHGNVYSKDFPDLTVIDPRGEYCRFVELKALEMPATFPHLGERCIPKSLTPEQRNKLTELGSGKHVGGMLAVEWVNVEQDLAVLHLSVPGRVAFDQKHGWNLEQQAFKDRMPRIFPKAGEIVYTYSISNHGLEFDRFLWWAFMLDWWNWKTYEQANDAMVCLAWPTARGLCDPRLSSFSMEVDGL